ncbi:hypothetical protein [Streptomyces avermitilis]|uniref:hypothetical protein n=1 Tax=Streptomyces avermitilis TaxID=33903 RepID=UPI0033D987C2
MRDPRRALAETLSHIDALLGEGQSRDDVLDVHQLSTDSGVPQDVIRTLLDGKEPSEEDVTDRIVRRFEHLRETQRRPDGSRHSYDEIATSFGGTRASLSNLVNSRKKPKRDPSAQQKGEQRTARAGGPLASTAAGIEKFFFGEPNGWLSAEPESALNDALQPYVDTLRSTVEPASLRSRRAVALRSAADLPEDKWALLEGVINTLVQQVRRDQER